jgi:hypothetical protein
LEAVVVDSIYLWVYHRQGVFGFGVAVLLLDHFASRADAASAAQSPR